MPASRDAAEGRAHIGHDCVVSGADGVERRKLWTGEQRNQTEWVWIKSSFQSWGTSCLTEVEQYKPDMVLTEMSERSDKVVFYMKHDSGTFFPLLKFSMPTLCFESPV